MIRPLKPAVVSTSSTRQGRLNEVFDGLQKEFPEQHPALDRLKATISSWKPSESYTADVLFDLVEPDSKRVLISILGCLCEREVLRSFIRVRLPGEEDVFEFPRLLDVPLVLSAESGRSHTLLLEYLELRYAPYRGAHENPIPA